MAANLDMGYEAGLVQEERPLTASEQFQLENLTRQLEEEKRWEDYRERLMLKALEGQPTYTVELVKEFAEARARSALTMRTIDRLFPGRRA